MSKKSIPSAQNVRVIKRADPAMAARDKLMESEREQRIKDAKKK